MCHRQMPVATWVRRIFPHVDTPSWLNPLPRHLLRHLPRLLRPVRREPEVLPLSEVCREAKSLVSWLGRLLVVYS